MAAIIIAELHKNAVKVEMTNLWHLFKNGFDAATTTTTGKKGSLVRRAGYDYNFWHQKCSIPMSNNLIEHNVPLGKLSHDAMEVCAKGKALHICELFKGEVYLFPMKED